MIKLGHCGLRKDFKVNLPVISSSCWLRRALQVSIVPAVCTQLGLLQILQKVTISVTFRALHD